MILGVASPDKLIAPVGLVIETDVVPVIVLKPLIPPEPVAVSAIAVPVRAPPIDIELFVPVSIKDNAPPVALMLLVVVMPPLAESVRLNPPVPAVDAPLPVNATESVKVTVPAPDSVWLVVIFGVARPDKLIVPVGLVNETEVVPVMVLAPLIPPEPVAVNVIAVPVRAPPIDIGLLVPVSIKDKAPPVALILLVAVIPPLAESVRLKPPVPAVDAPLLVKATESVKVTLPAPDIV
jgi:hypothetical protein